MEIAIVAGEVSGDVQAASLVSAIKEISPNIKVWGIGGTRMKNSGVELIYDITQWAVVGFCEVVKNFKMIRRVFYGMLNTINERKPQAVILVDYPGFNLRLARKIKSLGIPIIYYISPQVWAWASGRVKQIKDTVTKMIVIFPFEREFYEKAGVSVEFVGHPVVDVLENRISRKLQFRQELGISLTDKLIGILPGSREQEVKRHLPVFLKAAKKIKGVRFVIGAASETLYELINTYDHSIPVFLNHTYDIMEASDLILTSSGTATLETASFGTPMVVIYKLNWLTYLFIKSMVDIPDIAMANVVAGKRIVPELVQHKATPSAVSSEAINILKDPERYERIKEELKRVKSKLGVPGSVRRAAKIICEFVHA